MPASRDRRRGSDRLWEGARLVGLKRRGAKKVRPVPIPPVLFGILRDHLDRCATGSDGRTTCATRRSRSG
ncbi:hypothetical protein GCM10018963_19410 [Saccharothrix longispora]